MGRADPSRGSRADGQTVSRCACRPRRGLFRRLPHRAAERRPDALDRRRRQDRTRQRGTRAAAGRRPYRRHRPDAGTGNAARKRGALPPDRRQRAGADMGHQARPHALLRQPGLCRFSRAAVRGSHRVRLAQAASPGRPAAGRAGIDRRRSLAQAVRAGSPLPATPTANGAGCGRNRSRAGTRPATTSASSASPTTSPPPSRPSTICAG